MLTAFLGEAKMLWIKSTSPRAAQAVIAFEDLNTPHIFITEETKSPFNPIRRRAHVQTYRNACTNLPSSTYRSYTASPEGEYESEYEVDQPASMFSEDSDHFDAIANDDLYRDLYAILGQSEHEWEPGETEYYAIPEADDEADNNLSDFGTENDRTSSNDPEDRDDDNASEASYMEAHCGDGPSFFADPGSSWTVPSLTSVFCPPTPVSTLGPSTPSDSESGPSTPHTPVLLHESSSYEDALFYEFTALTHVAGIQDHQERDEPKDQVL
jgi:hypothetical protein